MMDRRSVPFCVNIDIFRPNYYLFYRIEHMFKYVGLYNPQPISGESSNEM